MSHADWADLFTVVGGAAAALLLIPAAFAVYQYFQNSRTQRAQWLVNLFEKFYEKDAYREVRGLIEASERDELLSALSEDPDLEQKWTDYLNFFELVAYLQGGIGELKIKDVDAMFRYWIDELSPFEPYLEKYDYENLVQLLRRRSSLRERK